MEQTKTDYVSVSTHVSPSVHRALVALSERERRSQRQLLRMALEQFLKRHKLEVDCE